MEGWISLHRKIQNHWLWKEKRVFSKFEAWLDIIMLANHEDKKIVLGNELILVKRGEHITSEPKLADRWGWSRTKIRNFLKILEEDNMIINQKEDKKRTRLKVVNYNAYQGLEYKKKTTGEQRKNNERTTEEQGEDTNNNDNNSITTITVIGDELQGNGNQNPVTPEDSDSFKQEETDEDILTKLNGLDEEMSPVAKIEKHYAANVLNRTNVSSKDMEAIVGVFKEGYPVDFILKCIDEATERYKKNNDGKVAIHSFKYFIPFIHDEWQKLKLIEAAGKVNPIEPDIDISKIKSKTNSHRSNSYNSNNKPKNRFHNFKQKPIQYSNDELKRKLKAKKNNNGG